MADRRRDCQLGVFVYFGVAAAIPWRWVGDDDMREFVAWILAVVFAACVFAWALAAVVFGVADIVPKSGGCLVYVKPSVWVHCK